MDNKDGNKVSFNSTGYTGYPKMETKLVLIFHGILKSLPNVALKLDILYHFHLQKDKKKLFIYVTGYFKMAAKQVRKPPLNKPILNAYLKSFRQNKIGALILFMAQVCLESDKKALNLGNSE